MKKSILLLISCLTLTSYSVMAADGVVKFVGAIVEPACNVNMIKSNVSMKCGKTVNTFNVNDSEKAKKSVLYTISEEKISKNAKNLMISYK